MDGITLTGYVSMLNLYEHGNECSGSVNPSNFLSTFQGKRS
jgi:hypothetical protein